LVFIESGVHFIHNHLHYTDLFLYSFRQKFFLHPVAPSMIGGQKLSLRDIYTYTYHVIVQWIFVTDNTAPL